MPNNSLALQKARLEHALGAGELLRQYRPNPGGQVLLDRTQKNEILFLGGNDAGKTYSGIRMVGCHLIGEKDIHGEPTGFTIHPHRRIRIPRSGMECWISCWSEKIQIDNIKSVYDKLLAPYEINKQVEGGARKWAEFETGRIDFKWQAAGEKSYTGPKKHFILLDEPHKRAIYNECRMRITKYKGTMLSTLTPVLDEDTTGASLADIQWLWEEIILPCVEHPKDYAVRDIIFCKLEENAAYIDVDFHKEMMKGMSPAEIAIRETGMILPYSKRSCFDADMLSAITYYLKGHPEESTPDYGNLEYDDRHGNNDDHRVIFVPSVIENFPYKPKGKWALMIWEHPLERGGLVGNEYYIGVDAAEGKLGGDYTAVYVRKQSGEMVACLHGHITELELAKQLYLLGNYYCDANYKPAMIAIEVVSIGHVTQSYLITGSQQFGIPKYGLGRIYHRPSPTDMSKALSISGGQPGWYTTGTARGELIGAMRRGMVNAYDAIQRGNPCPIKDIWLMEEARRFILSKHAKYEATPGVSFDDRLFAWAIADKCREQYTRRDRVQAALEKKIADDVDYYEDENGLLHMNIDGILNRGRTKTEAKNLIL